VKIYFERLRDIRKGAKNGKNSMPENKPLFELLPNLIAKNFLIIVQRIKDLKTTITTRIVYKKGFKNPNNNYVDFI